jgi:protein transport protein SEC24
MFSVSFFLEERRIRVITSCLPLTNNLSEVYTSIDEGALAIYLSKLAIEKAISHRLEDARDAILNKCVDILSTWKTHCATNNQALSCNAPKNIRTLPLLLLGILKHVRTRLQSTSNRL